MNIDYVLTGSVLVLVLVALGALIFKLWDRKPTPPRVVVTGVTATPTNPVTQVPTSTTTHSTTSTTTRQGNSCPWWKTPLKFIAWAFGILFFLLLLTLTISYVPVENRYWILVAIGVVVAILAVGYVGNLLKKWKMGAVFVWAGIFAFIYFFIRPWMLTIRWDNPDDAKGPIAYDLIPGMYTPVNLADYSSRGGAIWKHDLQTVYVYFLDSSVSLTGSNGEPVDEEGISHIIPHLTKRMVSTKGVKSIEVPKGASLLFTPTEGEKEGKLYITPGS